MNDLRCVVKVRSPEDEKVIEALLADPSAGEINVSTVRDANFEEWDKGLRVPGLHDGALIFRTCIVAHHDVGDGDPARLITSKEVTQQRPESYKMRVTFSHLFMDKEDFGNAERDPRRWAQEAVAERGGHVPDSWGWARERLDAAGNLDVAGMIRIQRSEVAACVDKSGERGIFTDPAPWKDAGLGRLGVDWVARADGESDTKLLQRALQMRGAHGLTRGTGSWACGRSWPTTPKSAGSGSSRAPTRGGTRTRCSPSS